MKKIIFCFLISNLFISCNKESPKKNPDEKTLNTNEVLISSFDCSGINYEGSLQLNTPANNVSVTINYYGGNGKSYLTRTYKSYNVTGLTATLFEGTLLNGEGKLNFIITGIPQSIGNAKFDINFGGKVCTINLIIEDEKISDLYCNEVEVSDKIVENQILNNFTAIIKYKGGNGKLYSTKTHNSKGVTGLTATLFEGNLANGDGKVVYKITGTPSSSGVAIFEINIGGISCSLKLNVEKQAFWDEKLLFGKWVSVNTLFYKYFPDHNGLVWDTRDDVTESEAQKFTWKLINASLTQIHIMEIGGNVPKVYTITNLSSTSLEYKDDFGNVTTFTRVL